MKLLISDTEVDIEAEHNELLEWVWQGNHLHAKLVRGRPYKAPFSNGDLTTKRME